MNTAPFESWDGVEAYYTWADAPLPMYFSLVLVALIVVAVTVASIVHENKSFKRADGL